MLTSWTLLRSVTVQLWLHEFKLLMNCWWHVCITWNEDKSVIVLRRMRKVQSETAHLTGASSQMSCLTVSQSVFFCSLLRWLPIILESDYSILLVVHMICFFFVVAQGDDNFHTKKDLHFSPCMASKMANFFKEWSPKMKNLL